MGLKYRRRRLSRKYNGRVICTNKRGKKRRMKKLPRDALAAAAAA
jgi:hypothetical protein